MVESIIQLKCSCNNYPWGKKGHESVAAQLCSKTPGTGFEIEDEKEYAEMWMGTYPTTPSYVLSTGELLQDVLSRNKEELIGKKVLGKFGEDLPFLPKILSIAKALPLQLHPNKDLSSKLHESNPEQFGDPNHKPEIAVALRDDFEVFAGFKPIAEIQELCELPQIKESLGDDLLKRTPFSSTTKWEPQSHVPALLQHLLTLPASQVTTLIKAISKIPSSSIPSNSQYIPKLVPRLADQYGDTDPAIPVALLAMNFMTLSYGQALYIPADGIHAYLSGDIFECMARSDNVVNVGFCPGADRDNAELFTGTLKVDDRVIGPEGLLLNFKKDGRGRNGKTVVYEPALTEFKLLVTNLKAGSGEKETVDSIDGPSIMIVIGGKGKLKGAGSTKPLKRGYIYFVGKGVELEFEEGEAAGEEDKDDNGDFVIFRAYAE